MGMRVRLSERTIKPNNGYIAKHGAIELRVSLSDVIGSNRRLGGKAPHGFILVGCFYARTISVLFILGAKVGT